ncbi:MAG TPA: TAXI family TRAP transporter solute-binding subunit [Methylocystis sp.]|nr:TAXI family TRAP transporter solute-binding subunit [Methylocystis sp.]
MRKTLFATVAALLVAVGGAAAALYFYQRPTTLVVAVPQVAEDQRLMNAAERLFAEEHKQISLRSLPVADSAAAATMIDSGKADLAVMRGDVAMTTSAQVIAILHRNAALLLAPPASKLKKVTDLRGKRIGVVHEIGAMDPNARLLQAILEQYDVPAQAVTLVSLSPSDVRGAIEENKVDAVFAATPQQTALAEAIVNAVSGATKKSPTFIAIKEAKAISKRFPALEPMEIEEGAFGGDPPRPAAAVESLSVSVLLMARSSLRDEVAATVTRLFFSHRGSIARAAPIATAIEAPSTDRGGAIPVHQGAIDYLDDNERDFFERYSDFIYIGAMFLSLIGSCAAALASRLNEGAHEHVEELTESLLELLRSARGAESFAELDALEREANDAMMKVLGDRKLRNVGGHGLHLVTLALDQTRRAIEERRAILAAGERRVIEFPGARSAPPVA